MKSSFALAKVLRDPAGAISLIYIALISFVAIFAGFLAPDKTANANQMHLSLHSKPPGHQSKLLLVPAKDGSILEEIPIASFHWDKDQLIYQAETAGPGYNQSIDRKRFPETMSQKEIEESFLVKRTFWWGTDKFGRDLFSRMLLGSRVSLSIGFIAVLISLLVGIFMGGLAGFMGGRIDKVILWFINVIWSIPSLLMIIAITLALGKGFWQVFIAVGLTMWVEVARLVRGQVISIKEQSFVQATRVLGYSDLRIFLHHIFPLLIPSLIVISTANFASAILIESGLSFLGIGAQPPMPSWGGMIKDHFRYILMGKAYLALIPGAAIMSLVLAFMSLGNSFRDALDIKN